jgi:hypothetical protein
MELKATDKANVVAPHREPIFMDDHDRVRFLETPAETCMKGFPSPSTTPSLHEPRRGRHARSRRGAVEARARLLGRRRPAARPAESAKWLRAAAFILTFEKKVSADQKARGQQLADATLLAVPK